MPAAHDPRQNHLLAAVVTGQILKEEFTQAGALQRLLLRYTQALLTQIARTCECYAVVKKECDRLLPDSTAA